MRWLKKTILISAIGFVLHTPTSVYAQDKVATKEKFRHDIVRLSNDDDFLMKLASSIAPDSKQKQKIYKNMFHELFQDASFQSYFANAVAENYGSVKDYEALGAALFIDMAYKGILRLDENDMAEFVDLLGFAINQAPTNDCAKMLRGDDKDGFLTLSYFDAKHTVFYANLFKRAILAEANDFPHKKRITIEQKRVSQEAFVSSVMRSINVRNDLDRYLNVSKNNNHASDEDLCWVGKINVKAILNMEGQPKNWMLIDFMDSLASQ